MRYMVCSYFSPQPNSTLTLWQVPCSLCQFAVIISMKTLLLQEAILLYSFPGWFFFLNLEGTHSLSGSPLKADTMTASHTREANTSSFPDNSTIWVWLFIRSSSLPPKKWLLDWEVYIDCYNRRIVGVTVKSCCCKYNRHVLRACNTSSTKQEVCFMCIISMLCGGDQCQGSL